jgi:uncharacterized membrane protein
MAAVLTSILLLAATLISILHRMAAMFTSMSIILYPIREAVLTSITKIITTLHQLHQLHQKKKMKQKQGVEEENVATEKTGTNSH